MDKIKRMQKMIDRQINQSEASKIKSKPTAMGLLAPRKNAVSMKKESTTGKKDPIKVVQDYITQIRKQRQEILNAKAE